MLQYRFWFYTLFNKFNFSAHIYIYTHEIWCECLCQKVSQSCFIFYEFLLWIYISQICFFLICVIDSLTYWQCSKFFSPELSWSGVSRCFFLTHKTVFFFIFLSFSVSTFLFFFYVSKKDSSIYTQKEVIYKLHYYCCFSSFIFLYSRYT